MLGSAFLGLSAMTQPGASGGAVGPLLRAGQAAGSASLAAAYLALEFFPGLPMLQVRRVGFGVVEVVGAWVGR